MTYDRIAIVTGTNADRTVRASVPCFLIDDGEAEPLGGDAVAVDKKAHRYTLTIPLQTWREEAALLEPLPGFRAEVSGVAPLLVDSVVSLGGEVLMVSCTASGGPTLEGAT